MSQHYDLVIGDDLVSRNNITTKEQIDKVKQYWKDLLSLLDIGGMIINIGTRWNYDDLHGLLLKDQSYLTFVRGAFDKDGEPIFPEKFTKEYLKQLRGEIGSYDFACLYLNDPSDNENADFKRSYFENRYENQSIIGKRLNFFATIDNAPSTKKGSDWQGIIVNGVDENNKWYLVHIERFKGDTPALINKIFWINDTFHPQIIGIEQKAYEDLIKPFLDAECQRRNKFPNVIELKDKGIRKEDRIRGRLQGRFETKSIFLQAQPQDDTDCLIDEGCRFPVGQYDDLLDALQYQDEIAVALAKEEDEEVHSIYGNQNYS